MLECEVPEYRDTKRNSLIFWISGYNANRAVKEEEFFSAATRRFRRVFSCLVPGSVSVSVPDNPLEHLGTETFPFLITTAQPDRQPRTTARHAVPLRGRRRLMQGAGVGADLRFIDAKAVFQSHLVIKEIGLVVGNHNPTVFGISVDEIDEARHSTDRSGVLMRKRQDCHLSADNSRPIAASLLRQRPPVIRSIRFRKPFAGFSRGASHRKSGIQFGGCLPQHGPKLRLEISCWIELFHHPVDGRAHAPRAARRDRIRTGSTRRSSSRSC